MLPGRIPLIVVAGSGFLSDTGKRGWVSACLEVPLLVPSALADPPPSGRVAVKVNTLQGSVVHKAYMYLT